MCSNASLTTSTNQMPMRASSVWNTHDLIMSGGLCLCAPQEMENSSPNILRNRFHAPIAPKPPHSKRVNTTQTRKHIQLGYRTPQHATHKKYRKRGIVCRMHFMKYRRTRRRRKENTLTSTDHHMQKKYPGHHRMHLIYSVKTFHLFSTSAR